MAEQLRELAVNLVARGKGILAADETVPTLARRFDALHISSTQQARRNYRKMLFTFSRRRGVHRRHHNAGRDDPSERRGRGGAAELLSRARGHAGYRGRYRRPVTGGMPRGKP